MAWSLLLQARYSMAQARPAIRWTLPGLMTTLRMTLALWASVCRWRTLVRPGAGRSPLSTVMKRAGVVVTCTPAKTEHRCRSPWNPRTH